MAVFFGACARPHLHATCNIRSQNLLILVLLQHPNIPITQGLSYRHGTVFALSRLPLVSCFSAERLRKCLKIAKFYFCTFATSPLAALACPTKISGDQASLRRPRLCSQWAGCKRAKIVIFNFKMLPMPPRSPKTKKAMFRVSRSRLMCWAHKPKIVVFRFATLFCGSAQPPKHSPKLA